MQGAGGGLGLDDYMRIAGAGRGGGPVSTIAAHWQPTARQTQVTQGTQLSPETQEAIAKQTVNEQETVAAADKLAAQQAIDEANKAKVMALYDQAQVTQQKLTRDRQESQLAEYKDHVDSMMRDAAQPDVSASHKYWGDKSTFGRVMTGLGMALQGFVFGASGRGGDPGEWLNQQIAQTAQDQAAEARKKQNAVGNAANQYQQLRDKFGDDERAQLALQLAQRQGMLSTLDAAAKNDQLDAAERLRAKQLYGSLYQTQAKQRLELDEKTADHVVTSGAEHFVPTQTIGGGGLDPLALLRRAAEAKKLLSSMDPNSPEARKLEADISKTEAEASGARAKAQGGVDPEAQEKLSKALVEAHLPVAKVDLQEANDLLNKGGLSGLRIRALVAGIPGATAVSSSDERRLSQVIDQLADAKVKSSGGRLTEDMIPIIKKQIVGNGSPEDVRRGITGIGKEIEANEQTIRAGYAPAVGSALDSRLQGAGVQRPPGFQPGVATAPSTLGGEK